MASFENTCFADSRFERAVSQNFFRNRQISSETPNFFPRLFWDPNASLGQKCPKNPAQQQPKQAPSFRKWDERGWKSTLSSHRLKEGSEILWESGPPPHSGQKRASMWK